MSPAAVALLTAWTLWLVAASHLLAVVRAGSAGNRGRVTLRLEHPAAVALRTVRPARMSVAVVWLGLILVLTMLVTWRVYLVAALAVQAILTAFAVSADPPPPRPAGGSGQSAVGIVAGERERLVVSSVSLAGMLWLGLQAGGAYGQYVAEIRMPALATLAAAVVVYGQILVVPALRRRPRTIRALVQRVSVAERELVLERQARRGAEENLRDLASEMQRLSSGAGVLGETEHAAHPGGYTPPMTYYVVPVPEDSGGLNEQGQQAHSSLIRVVATRCYAEYRPPTTVAGGQQVRWVLERSVLTAPAGHIVGIALSTASQQGEAVSRGPGERLHEAIDDYVAKTVGDPAFKVFTERWIVRDPGGFNAIAQGSARVRRGVHQFLAGTPAQAVCHTLGIPGPGAAVFGGIASEVALPVDRPLGVVKRLVELAGMAAGALLGNPVLTTACCKAFAHDMSTRVLATAVGEITASGEAPDAHHAGPARPPRDPPAPGRPAAAPPTGPGENGRPPKPAGTPPTALPDQHPGHPPPHRRPPPPRRIWPPGPGSPNPGGRFSR